MAPIPCPPSSNNRSAPCAGGRPPPCAGDPAAPPPAAAPCLGDLDGGRGHGGAGASPPAHSEASRLCLGGETTGVLPPSAARDARAAAARPSCHTAAPTHPAPGLRSGRPPGAVTSRRSALPDGGTVAPDPGERGGTSERAAAPASRRPSVRPSLPGLAGAAARRARWGALTGDRSSPLHSFASLARSLPLARPFPHPRPRPLAHRDGGADGAALGSRRPRPGWNPAAGTPRGRSIPGLHAAASAPPPGGRGRAGGAGAAAGRGRRGGGRAWPGRADGGGRTGGAGSRTGGRRGPGSGIRYAARGSPTNSPRAEPPPPSFLLPRPQPISSAPLGQLRQSAAPPCAGPASQSGPRLPLPVSNQSEPWVGRPNAGGSTRRPREAVRGVVGPGGRGTVPRVVEGAVFFAGFLDFLLVSRT